MKEPARKRWPQTGRVAMLAALTLAGFGGLAAALFGPSALVGASAVASTSERLVVDRRTGLAIGGIDPVAYFTDGKMLAGRPGFELQTLGAVWRFQNEGNRAVFLADPEIYAPQFGGYDPLDVARGVAVAGNPQFWLIHRERLYLFARQDSRSAFATDPEKILQAAIESWPALVDTLAQ